MMVPYVQRLGLKPVILGPNADSPGGQVAQIVIGDYRDAETVIAFSEGVHVLTVEFEDVNADGLDEAERRGLIVRPSPRILRTIKDKFRQKTLLSEMSPVSVAAFAEVSNVEDVARFAAEHDYPVVLKQRFGSYDGYGNAVILDRRGIEAPFTTMSAKSSLYVEAHVPFRRELALVLTRGVDGEIVHYPLVETRQVNGICAEVIGPISDRPVAVDAVIIGTVVARALDYIGTLAIELFELEDGRLWVNELAPRVHNSGHWSIEGARTSQFENHVRAVMGYPLGRTDMTCASFAMKNILGAENAVFDGEAGLPLGWSDALDLDVSLHWYGKSHRLGRKLGHITSTVGSAGLLPDNRPLTNVCDARSLICC